MKIKSKSEIKKTADKVFKTYPKANEVYATLDGNVFLSKNRAELHASGLSEKNNTVIPFVREGGETVLEKRNGLPSVSKLKEMLSGISEENELVDLLEQEKNGEDRKTALSAIQERIDELNDPAEDIEVNEPKEVKKTEK